MVNPAPHTRVLTLPRGNNEGRSPPDAEIIEAPPLYIRRRVDIAGAAVMGAFHVLADRSDLHFNSSRCGL